MVFVTNISWYSLSVYKPPTNPPLSCTRISVPMNNPYIKIWRVQYHRNFSFEIIVTDYQSQPGHYFLLPHKPRDVPLQAPPGETTKNMYSSTRPFIIRKYLPVLYQYQQGNRKQVQASIKPYYLSDLWNDYRIFSGITAYEIIIHLYFMHG